MGRKKKPSENAPSAGKPTKSTVVRIHPDLAEKLRIIAAIEHQDASDVLSEISRAGILERYEQAKRKLAES